VHCESGSHVECSRELKSMLKQNRKYAQGGCDISIPIVSGKLGEANRVHSPEATSIPRSYTGDMLGPVELWRARRYLRAGMIAGAYRSGRSKKLAFPSKAHAVGIPDDMTLGPATTCMIL